MGELIPSGQGGRGQDGGGRGPSHDLLDYRQQAGVQVDAHVGLYSG